jgi:hypothetical protein
MLYDQLHEIAVHADLRQMTGEAAALVIGAIVLVAVVMRRRRRIWTRIEALESQLAHMQNEIAALLQVQTALITRLKAKSQIEINPGDTRTLGDSDVVGLTMSPPTTPAQSRSAKPAKLPG